MSFKHINPESLGRPRGYTNGLLTTPGVRLLFVAGQVAWDERQRIVGDDFVEQFDRALRNVLEVVREAGGAPGGGAAPAVYGSAKSEDPPAPPKNRGTRG